MDESVAALPKPRLATPAFLLVVTAALAYFFAIGVLVPAVPRYVAGPLAAGDAAVGVTVGAFSLTALLLRPWAGRLADRRGRSLLMIGGAGIVAVCVAGYSLAGVVPVLVALRLLTGVGEALFWVGAVAATGDLAPPERRAEAMSWSSLSLYLGLALGPPVGEFMVDEAGYLATWLVASGAAMTALLLSLRIGETRAPASGPVSPARFRVVHPAGLVPAAMLLTAVFGMAGLLAFVPLYARDLGLSGAGPLLFGFAGIVVLIRSAGARLPDRLGPARATTAALACATVGLTVIGLWRSPAGLVGGAALLAVGVALATPSIMALAWAGAPDSERGAVTGTVGMSVDLGLGLGPVTFGLVAAQSSRGGAFLAGAVVAGLGLALALWSARRRAVRTRVG